MVRYAAVPPIEIEAFAESKRRCTPPPTQSPSLISGTYAADGGGTAPPVGAAPRPATVSRTRMPRAMTLGRTAGDYSKTWPSGRRRPGSDPALFRRDGTLHGDSAPN